MSLRIPGTLWLENEKYHFCCFVFFLEELQEAFQKWRERERENIQHVLQTLEIEDEENLRSMLT